MGGEIQKTVEGFEWQAKDLGLHPSKERERDPEVPQRTKRRVGKMTLDHMQEGKARVKKRTWETVTTHV